MDSFSLRASFGESFLTPSASQLRSAVQGNCTDIPDDDPDPITGLSMETRPSCLSGNPDLRAEESDLYNIGFSWLPIEGLSIDIDYQEIEYFDKIETLVSDEVTQAQYRDFLAATSYTDEAYDTGNPDHVANAVAWVLENPHPLVSRFPDGSVDAIVRAPVNYSSQFVKGFDIRARYGFDFRDWGRFSARLGGNYYTRWEYQQAPASPIVDANGNSNSTTGFAPPISKWKGNLGLSWFRDNQSASMTLRHRDEMNYDQDTVTLGYDAADFPVIESISTVDARYSYRFDINRLGADANVTLGITNLFDHMPQRLPRSKGMETRVDNPFGRQFYLSLDLDM